MAGGTAKDRVSPPLAHIFRASHAARDAKKKLDLRDHGGERVIATRRTSSRLEITEPILRRNVSADLDMLMNAVNLGSSIDLGDLDFVKTSIVNHGLPDITHRTIDEGDVDVIVDEIRTALIAYEPRLAPATLHVERDKSLDSVELRIRFFIRAEMICDPIAVAITFVADLQFETGAFTITQQ